MAIQIPLLVPSPAQVGFVVFGRAERYADVPAMWPDHYGESRVVVVARDVEGHAVVIAYYTCVYCGTAKRLTHAAQTPVPATKCGCPHSRSRPMQFRGHGRRGWVSSDYEKIGRK
jgi:hypothetical protein